jgi:predicted SnoaL-like aldol condensation-catalyzing enzyme
VLACYQQAFTDGRPEQAAAHLGTTYTQHNPCAPDGVEGFIGDVHWLRGQFTEPHPADRRRQDRRTPGRRAGSPEKSSNDNAMF